MTRSNASPWLYRELLERAREAAGADLWMQVAGRATGLLFSGTAPAGSTCRWNRWCAR